MGELTKDQIDTLIRNLEETSPNEGSHDLACRCADSLRAIRQFQAQIAELECIQRISTSFGKDITDKAMQQAERIVELEAQNKALADACKKVQMEAVGLGAGENSISDKARDMVDAALAQYEGEKKNG